MRRTEDGLLTHGSSPDWLSMGEMKGKLETGVAGPAASAVGEEWSTASPPEDRVLPRAEREGEVGRKEQANGI